MRGIDPGQGVRGAWGAVLGIGLALALGAAACGGDAEGKVLRLDASFDPAMATDEFAGVSETDQAVAQTFTVLADGKLEEIRLLLSDGPSADDGTIRVDVRPVDGMGVPELSPGTAIASLEIDTTELPAVLVEEYIAFDYGDQPGRLVQAGEVYAIVVEFVSRDTSTDTNAIALLLGIDGMGGDPYPDGDAFTGASNVAFTPIPDGDDFVFRTYSLQ